MSFSPTAFTTKAQWRIHFKNLRASFCPAEKSAAEKIIMQKAYTYLQLLLANNSVIVGYSAIHGEVDVLPLLTHLHNQGHRCALPVIVEKSNVLNFREWYPEMALVPGHIAAILEPPPTVLLVQPTLLLVPFLGCDYTGHRLGYGKGMYDRTICSLREQKFLQNTIGVGYSFQLVNKLPCDAKDERLDTVITEKITLIL